jgi:hypothetical protein
MPALAADLVRRKFAVIPRGRLRKPRSMRDLKETAIEAGIYLKQK